MTSNSNTYSRVPNQASHSFHKTQQSNNFDIRRSFDSKVTISIKSKSKLAIRNRKSLPKNANHFSPNYKLETESKKLEQRCQERINRIQTQRQARMQKILQANQFK